MSNDATVRRLWERMLSSSPLVASPSEPHCHHPSMQEHGRLEEGAQHRGFPLVVFSGATMPERVAQFSLLGGIWLACNVWMYCLNTTVVCGEGVTTLREAFLSRKPGQALITLSNHVAAMDDPLMIASVMPPQTALSPKDVRWTFCATDRCFATESYLLDSFFRLTKVVPLQRGGGTEQRGLDDVCGRLKFGDWIHFFPEGTRSVDSRTLGEIKLGVGKLLCAAVGRDDDIGDVESSAVASSSPSLQPIIVPILHRGLEHVMPRDRSKALASPYIPLSVGHNVVIGVGESITADVVYAIDVVDREFARRRRMTSSWWWSWWPQSAGANSIAELREQRYRNVARVVDQKLRALHKSLDETADG